MLSATLKNLPSRYAEAFEKADLGIIRELFAEDAVLEDPVGSAPRQGIEAICGFYKDAFDKGVKLNLLGAPRCAGNSVAFMFEVVIGNMKISPIDVFEVNAQGKIQHMRAYWGMDNLASS